MILYFLELKKLFQKINLIPYRVRSVFALTNSHCVKIKIIFVKWNNQILFLN